MAKVFASLVEKGVMKIEKVPDELKKEVKAILAANAKKQDSFFVTQEGGGTNGCSISNVNHQRKLHLCKGTTSGKRSSEANLD